METRSVRNEQGTVIGGQTGDGRQGAIGRSADGDFYAGKDGQVYRRDDDGWNKVEVPDDRAAQFDQARGQASERRSELSQQRGEGSGQRGEFSERSGSFGTRDAFNRAEGRQASDRPSGRSYDNSRNRNTFDSGRRSELDRNRNARSGGYERYNNRSANAGRNRSRSMRGGRRRR